jgi:hypothetical protein
VERPQLAEAQHRPPNTAFGVPNAGRWCCIASKTIKSLFMLRMNEGESQLSLLRFSRALNVCHTE